MEIGIGTRLQHTRYGQGVVIDVHYAELVISFIEHGIVTVDRNDDQLDEIIAEQYKPVDETSSEMERRLLNILRKWNGMGETVPLGERWKGGTLTLQPADGSLKPKELPIETFFHKIVMLRDRLRVLEQHINSHKQLGDEEKVNLQQYITRIYGSLTTFNVLFQQKEQQFTGEKGEG